MEVSKEKTLFIPKETNFLHCKDAGGETLINHQQNPPLRLCGWLRHCRPNFHNAMLWIWPLNCYSKWKKFYLFHLQNISWSNNSHFISKANFCKLTNLTNSFRNCFYRIFFLSLENLISVWTKYMLKANNGRKVKALTGISIKRALYTKRILSGL